MVINCQMKWQEEWCELVQIQWVGEAVAKIRRDQVRVIFNGWVSRLPTCDRNLLVWSSLLTLHEIIFALLAPPQNSGFCVWTTRTREGRSTNPTTICLINRVRWVLFAQAITNKQKWSAQRQNSIHTVCSMYSTVLVQHTYLATQRRFLSSLVFVWQQTSAEIFFESAHVQKSKNEYCSLQSSATHRIKNSPPKTHQKIPSIPQRKSSKIQGQKRWLNLASIHAKIRIWRSRIIDSLFHDDCDCRVSEIEGYAGRWSWIRW